MGIGDRDQGSGLDFAIGDWDLDGELVLGIRIGDCEFGIGSEYWGLGWD